MTEADTAIGWISGILVVSAFLIEGIALHLIHTRSEEILGYFKKSPALFAKEVLLNGGPYGKLVLIGNISAVVTFPAAHLANNRLDKNDLKKLPHELKRKLVAIQWSFITLVFSGITAVTTIKILAWADVISS